MVKNGGNVGQNKELKILMSLCKNLEKESTVGQTKSERSATFTKEKKKKKRKENTVKEEEGRRRELNKKILESTNGRVDFENGNNLKKGGRSRYSWLVLTMARLIINSGKGGERAR